MTSFEEEIQNNGYLIYTNVGTSMMPMLREHKDLVCLKKVNVLHKYDVVLYKRQNRYILHRILKIKGNNLIICGDNNLFREYDIKRENILGVLYFFVRDGKEISTTNKGYLIYVHLWCDFFYIRVFFLFWIHIIIRVLNRIKRIYKK